MNINVRFGSKADMGACVRDVRFTPKSGHKIQSAACPPSQSTLSPHPQTLSPPPPTPLDSRRPFQMPGGADVRWRTVRDGPAQQERGRKLAPRQCCRQRENVGDAPGRDAIWGMAADKPLRSRGAAKAASISTKRRAGPAPLPVTIPSGTKRREARPRASPF
jgi:hypothetical protein